MIKTKSTIPAFIVEKGLFDKMSRPLYEQGTDSGIMCSLPYKKRQRAYHYAKFSETAFRREAAAVVNELFKKDKTA
jgi:hypothetical protein